MTIRQIELAYAMGLVTARECALISKQLALKVYLHGLVTLPQLVSACTQIDRECREEQEIA